MPSLTDSLGLAFTIASWLGFTVFLICASFGGYLLVKVALISWRVTYARWRWKKYQLEIEGNKNYLFAHKLANEFIREANKTMATEPTPPPNPYTTQKNEQSRSQASGGSTQKGTTRKVQ